jgi:ParB-like chromosome segregation protein Spo0J
LEKLHGSPQVPARALVVRRVAIESLKVDPANARLHGERNLGAIVASLQRWGQAEPLVVNARTGRLVAGHGRLEATRKLGWRDADIVEVDLAEIDATALGIALNRTAELAEWDGGALAALLEQLGAEDALAGVGFEEVEIQTLLRDLEAQLGAADLADPGPGEPPEDPVTRVGDLWILGDHRLLCGDSTSAEALARLMGEEKAQLLCTDPPYLVDYRGGNHPQSWANRPETRDKHWDDYVDPASGLAFFRGFLETALAHCAEDVVAMQWHAHRRQALVEKA